MRPNELCQLAANWGGKLPDGGAWCEEKKDGWRALAFRTQPDARLQLWTRNGHEIHGATHILHVLRNLERVAGQPLFFDGEFQVGGTLEATKAWCESGWRLGGTAGTFYLFDCLPWSDWQRLGGGPRQLYERQKHLAEIWETLQADEAFAWEWREGSRGADEDVQPVVLMPGTWVFDAGDVLDEARRVWVRGGEGIVLKDAAAKYQRNRNSAWQKVKPGGSWQRAL